MNLVISNSAINHGEAEKYHIGCPKCSACDNDSYTIDMTFNSTDVQVDFSSSKHPESASIHLEDKANSVTQGIYTDSILTNFQLNGRSYENVMIFSYGNSLINGLRIQKIIIAKSIGIIAIYGIQGIWFIKDSSTKSIKVSDSKYTGIGGC